MHEEKDSSYTATIEPNGHVEKQIRQISESAQSYGDRTTVILTVGNCSRSTSVDPRDSRSLDELFGIDPISKVTLKVKGDEAQDAIYDIMGSVGQYPDKTL